MKMEMENAKNIVAKEVAPDGYAVEPFAPVWSDGLVRVYVALEGRRCGEFDVKDKKILSKCWHQ